MTVFYKKFSVDSGNNYLYSILVLALTYFVFEMIFIPHAALFRDEFWFAHHIYQYLHYLPYRDFLPYKPVLGYYLLTFPMIFSHSALAPLYYIKDQIAFINTLFIIGTSLWAARYFQPKAIIATLIIIMASQFFLMVSADLRVDMLASWLVLVSLLFIFSNRFILSGFIVGVAFLVSQKALWSIAATDVAFAICWIFFQRDKRLFFNSIKFNSALLLVISLYIIIWAQYSDFYTVLNSVFYEGYIQSKITWYQWMYYSCWRSILSSGPLLIFLWPYTWVSYGGCIVNNVIQQRRLFIAVYSSVMMILILTYQQPFPYNTVLSVPVFFILYADFFSWMFGLFKEESTFSLTQRQIFWITAISCLMTISAVLTFGLSYGYLIILLIFICLSALSYFPNLKNSFMVKNTIAISIVFTGVIYPLLSECYDFLLNYNYNDYQRYNITLVDQLLKEGGEYFAGTPLLYQKDQAIPGLRNLIGPAVDYLNRSNPDILPILIASLYLTPRTTQEILFDLKNKPVKLYVNNNRIEALPRVLRHYLLSQYKHFSGSVYLYAPLVLAKQRDFDVKFTGNYRLESKNRLRGYVDKAIVKNNNQIYLIKGHHRSHAMVDYRLVYMPDKKYIHLNSTFQSYQRDLLGSN